MLSYEIKLYTHSLVLTCVILLTSVSVHAASMDKMKITKPLVILKEGRSAEIPCLTIDRHDAYIWMKGNSIENSTEIASFIDGIASEDTAPFTVSENGTLFIEKVRLIDEGKYLCRASSEISDCTGVIMVYVQAVLDKFVLGVDLCQSKGDCAIFIDSSQASTLTCTATNAPHSMDLKWFNGSNEITDGIEFRSRDAQGGLHRYISSTLNIVNGRPSLLTCQAVDQKRINDQGLFVNVQLKAPVVPVTTSKPSSGWMVTAIILLIICPVTITVIVIMAVRSSRNLKQLPVIGKDDQQDGEHKELLETQKTDMKEKDELIARLQETQKRDMKEKDDTIERLKETQTKDMKEKDDIIERLKERQKHDMKEKDEIIEELKERQKHDMKEKDEIIEELKATQKKDMKETDIIIEQLKKSGIKDKDAEIQRLKAKLDNDVKEKDAEIQDLKKKQKNDIRDKDTEIQRLKLKRENDIKERDAEVQRLKDARENLIKDHKDEVKHLKETGQKEDTIKTLQEELKKTRNQLMSKESDLNSSIKERKKQEETIGKLEGELREKTKQLEKFLFNAENMERKLRMDKIKLKDTLQFVCKITPSPGGKEQLKQKKVNTVSTIKTKDMSKGVKFKLAYTAKSDNEEITQEVSDLIQNAVDGGSSCLISYATSGHDHMVTMTGAFDGRNEGLLMFSTQRLFKTVASLKEKNIDVDLSARYIIGMEVNQGKYKQTVLQDYSCLPKKVASIKEMEKTAVSDFQKEKEKLREYLMHIKGEEVSTRSKDCMVEYYIVTLVDKVRRSSGKISFVTLCGLQQLDECLGSATLHTSELVRIVSENIYDENCYSLLITHLHEGKKDESKKTLESLLKVQTEKNVFL